MTTQYVLMCHFGRVHPHIADGMVHVVGLREHKSMNRAQVVFLVAIRLDALWPNMRQLIMCVCVRAHHVYHMCTAVTNARVCVLLLLTLKVCAHVRPCVCVFWRT